MHIPDILSDILDCAPEVQEFTRGIPRKPSGNPRKVCLRPPDHVAPRLYIDQSQACKGTIREDLHDLLLKESG